MNYTLHQLKVFDTIARNGSITKAAEELHLTQPAVSIQLKNFQEQFEIPLTEVLGRKLYLTSFGQEIANVGRKILEESDLIHAKQMAHLGQLSGNLRITVVSTGKYIMPYLLTDFLKMHPGVELQMQVTNKQDVVASLEKNEVDFSLISVMPERLSLEAIPLMLNKLYLVGNTFLPNMSEKTNTLDVIKEVPLIYREEGSGTRRVMENFIAKNKITLRKKLELSSNEAVKQAVMAGLGYSIMPLIGIHYELEQELLRIIPVTGLPILSQWQLVWPKGKRFSPAAQAYLEYIQQQKEDIIHRKFGWYKSF